MKLKCSKCGSDYEAPTGQRLREIRHRADLTLVDLAKSIKRSVAYLSEVERGSRRVTPMLIHQYHICTGIKP